MTPEPAGSIAKDAKGGMYMKISGHIRKPEQLEEQTETGAIRCSVILPGGLRLVLSLCSGSHFPHGINLAYRQSRAGNGTSSMLP
jgi:hypothetical protein